MFSSESDGGVGAGGAGGAGGVDAAGVGAVGGAVCGVGGVGGVGAGVGGVGAGAVTTTASSWPARNFTPTGVAAAIVSPGIAASSMFGTARTASVIDSVDGSVVA